MQHTITKILVGDRCAGDEVGEPPLWRLRHQALVHPRHRLRLALHA